MARTTIKKKKKGQPLAASKDASRDVLPRTGMGAGATFVDSASKLMASYGKILVPAMIVVIIGFAAFLFWNQYSSSGEQQFKNKVDRAAMGQEEISKLKDEMEVLIAEADEDPALDAYAWYRYAVRTYGLLKRPYKDDQLSSAIGILESATEALSEHEEHASWHRHVAGLLARLKADQEFLAKSDNKKLLPWDHHSKAEPPQTRLVDGTGDGPPESINPIVAANTSAGTLRIMLYEDQAENPTKHLVSLFEEGFYNRTNFTALSFSNSFNATGPYRGATILGVGSQGRPVGVELKKPTTAKEDDDVDTVAVENPYNIEYGGNSLVPFEVGTVALARDPDDASRARSEFFIVIEPSDALSLSFLPIGKVLDGEDGMKVARRLYNAEIYYTYVEQKRKDTEYVPEVSYDGWPVPRKKVQKVPEAVRFHDVKTEVVPADSKLNPLVVLELENGDVVIELFEGVVPNTVANFINLIQEYFYNTECEFYRVEGSGTDVIQFSKEGGMRLVGGGFSRSDTREGYNYGIRNEAKDNERYEAVGLGNIRGTIAMWYQGAAVDSASTEFIINLKDYPDGDKDEKPYCVFGEVIFGLDLLAELKADDAANDANKIKSATVLRRRDHEYVPMVKYKDSSEYVKKKPVTLPKEAKAADVAK